MNIAVLNFAFRGHYFFSFRNEDVANVHGLKQQSPRIAP